MARPRSKSQDEAYDLYDACKHYKLDRVLQLLHEGMNPNHWYYAKSCNGKTPLHMACLKNSPDVVQPLIQWGAELEAVNDTGNTPLHCACLGGAFTSVKILLDESCSLGIKNNDGETPLDIAKEKKLTGIVNLLKSSNNRPPRDPLSIFPSLTQLSELPVDDVWLNIGLQLGLDQKALTAIEKKNKNSQECKTAMFLVAKRTFEFRFESLSKALLKVGALGGQAQLLVAKAAAFGLLDVLKHLSDVERCDLKATISKDGQTPLSLAYAKRHKDVVKYLVSIHLCDPRFVVNEAGDTPLHLECISGDLEMIKCLVIVTIMKDSLDKAVNKAEKSPLFLAYTNGQNKVVKYLVDILNCNPRFEVNEAGDTPFHLESSRGDLEMIKCLDGTKANLDKAVNKAGQTPLYLAYAKRHKNVVKYLVDECHCNPRFVVNTAGDTPFHLECISGDLEMIKCLDDGKIGDCLLPACQYNQRHIVDYLLIDRHFDANVKNEDDQTPLDLTTDDHIVRTLFKNGARADNVYKTHRKMLKKLFAEAAPENPLPILITGNGGAGKSTFLKALLERLSFGQRVGIVKAKPVVGVDKETVGIIPYLCVTKNFGRVTVYDFAGQVEFYASHSAVLRNAIHSSPPVVVFCCDLQKCVKEIKGATTCWMNLIHSQCSTLQDQAHVIVVGSHADLVEDPMSIEGIFEPIIKKFSKFKYVAFVPINCRLPDSPGMTNIRRHIENSSALLRSPVAITLNAHSFYIYLLDSFKDELAVSLKTVQEKIQADQKVKSKDDLLSFIPNTLPRVMEICSQLSQKGHILFLPNESSPEESYVVCDQPTLLSRVTGTVFAPKGFDQHCDLASSTGVVSLKTFSNEFKGYDLSMLISYMACLEFCFEIKDRKLVECIVKSASALIHDSRYLFFPGLIKIDVPDRVWESKSDLEFHFGWILQCSQEVQFFDSRCLQVLILRLVFTFHLAPIKESRHDIPSLQHFCSVWKSGICWSDDDGITCLVELIEHSKALAVQMRSKQLTPECLRLRSKIIAEVLTTAKDLCPRIETDESVIDPKQVTDHPLESISKLSLYSIRDTAAAVVSNKEVVKSMYGADSLKRLVQFEPYAALDKEVVRFLYHPDNIALKEKLSNSFLSCFADGVQNLESASLFHRILAQAMQSSQASPSLELVHSLNVWRNETEGTYQYLRTTLDQYSIYGGRNPLDLAGVVAPGDDPPIFTDRVLDTVSSPHWQPDQLNVDDHLKEVKIATSEVRAMWYHLGIELDIEEGTRKAIEKTHHHVVDDCFTALLEHWLKRTSPPSTWSALINALKSPSIGYVDLANEIEAKYVEKNVRTKLQTD